MTNKELNRDIKRLGAEMYRLSFDDTDTAFKYYDNEGRQEFLRLYYADRKFEAMTLKSVLIMLRINISRRYIALHGFGLFIELKELV